MISLGFKMLPVRVKATVGKPFASELEKLSASCATAHQHPITELADAVTNACHGPVYVIGTGGSLSAAEFATKMFDEQGILARAMTPLAFLQSRATLREASVFLFSAGGNNKDVLAAFDAAEARSATLIVNVCTNARSKLAQRASRTPAARHVACPLEAGRDGYLATNSLFAMTILIARAFEPSFKLSCNVADLVRDGSEGFSTHFGKTPPKHVVVLFSEWARAAATDLESKLSEAGIAGSMVADFRHFAHGRHNWLDKQGKETGLVVFSNSGDKTLADRTLSPLPRSIAKCRFHTPGVGPQVAIAQLLHVFGFVNAFGRQVGIDPGRPGVPSYGSKLYHLGPTLPRSRQRATGTAVLDIAQGVDRKLRAAKVGSEHAGIYRAGADEFLRRIRGAIFGALVADVDGTILPQNNRNGPIPKPLIQSLVALVDAGAALILATGRGDSIQPVLKSQFPKRTWPRVFVGYLNGAFCLPLTECEQFARACPLNDVLQVLHARMINHQILNALAHVKFNNCQITIRARQGKRISTLLQLIKGEIGAEDHGCRIFTSSHSVDILAPGVSKKSCISAAKSLISPQHHVISIGDSGCHPGNDCELLNHEYALSVDAVSPSTTNCWNFLPKDIRNVDGTIMYLNFMRLRDRAFTLHV